MRVLKSERKTQRETERWQQGTGSAHDAGFEDEGRGHKPRNVGTV